MAGSRKGEVLDECLSHVDAGRVCRNCVIAAAGLSMGSSTDSTCAVLHYILGPCKLLDQMSKRRAFSAASLPLNLIGFCFTNTKN